MEIDYGYHKCDNCGREEFMWGIKITKNIFVCDLCIQDINQKIEDRKEGAKHKAML
jgi:hypothetical protein